MLDCLNLICYGAGDAFDRFIRKVNFEKVKINSIIDKDLNKAKLKLTKLPYEACVSSLPEIASSVYDYVIICSDLYFLEMEQVLLKYGVSREKIRFSSCYPIAHVLDENCELLNKIFIKDEQMKFVTTTDIRGLQRERLISNFHKKAKIDYVRISTLELLAEQIIINNVEGQVAELGVFRGDFAQLINEIFPEKDLYLFDSFEGFNVKGYELDRVYKGKNNKEIFSFFQNTTVDYVLSKMSNPAKCIVKKGYFPETLAGVPEDIKWCLVSLDADLFAPTYEGLKYFWPRLAHGGYIIVHDYYTPTFDGARKAITKFSMEMNLPFLPVTDQHGSGVFMKQF